MEHVKHAAEQKMWRVRTALIGRFDGNLIDSATKTLMAAVIGALLLAGLCTLFSKDMLPTLFRRITEVFSYIG